MFLLYEINSVTVTSALSTSVLLQAATELLREHSAKESSCDTLAEKNRNQKRLRWLVHETVVIDTKTFFGYTFAVGWWEQTLALIRSSTPEGSTQGGELRLWFPLRGGFGADRAQPHYVRRR